jgi:hypothetical protein
MPVQGLRSRGLPVVNENRYTWASATRFWKEAGMKVSKSHFTGEYRFSCPASPLEARRGREFDDGISSSGLLDANHLKTLAKF